MSGLEVAISSSGSRRIDSEANGIFIKSKRLQHIHVNGDVLFQSKKSLIVDFDGEEFVFDCQSEDPTVKFYDLRYPEPKPQYVALSKILENWDIQQVTFSVANHELAVYGSERPKTAVEYDQEVKNG